jgi:DNA-binding transcriptional ArsR family regulator
VRTVTKVSFEPHQINDLASKAEHASLVLRCISNKSRLVILCQLVKGEKSVGELEQHVGLSQSALSQHLAILRTNGLVKTRRVSQTIFYSLMGTAAPAILAALYDLYCLSPELPGDDELL